MEHKQFDMNIKGIIKNEYIYSTITRFITIILGLIQSVLIARFLGAELRGFNAYISSIVSVGSIIITFGMHQAYPYFRKTRGKEAIYQDYMSLVSLVYATYMVLGFLCAFLLPVNIGIRAACVIIPLQGYAKTVDYIALVEHPNTRNKWWTIIAFLDVLYVAMLWLLVSRNKLWAISILVLADIIKSIIYARLLRVRIVAHKGLVTLGKELVKYGFFPMLALLMTTLNYRIDVIMLHQYDFINDAVIGVYSLGLSLSDKIVIIPDTLKGVLVSKLAKGAKDDEVAKVSRIGLWSSVLIFLLVSALGRWVIAFFYGNEYIDAYPIIVITAFGMLAVVYFKFISQYNIVNKRQKLNVALLSIAVVADIVLNLTFIPIWGIKGAALATSIGNCICGVVFIVYFCRKTGISIQEMIIPQKTDLEIIKAVFKKKKGTKH